MAETITLGRGTTVFDSGDVTIGASAADIVTLILGGQIKRKLQLELSVATRNMSSFVIQLQDHPEGEFYDYLSDADFDSTAIVSMLFATTAGPHEVTANNKAHAIVELGAPYAVKLRGTCSGAGGVVRVRGNVAREH